MPTSARLRTITQRTFPRVNKKNIKEFESTSGNTNTFPNKDVSFYEKSTCSMYDYDASLSAGAAKYTMTIEKRTVKHGIFLGGEEQTYHIATVKMWDYYNFDAEREEKSFGDVMNNIGYDLEKVWHVITPYYWDSEFVMSNQWGD